MGLCPGQRSTEGAGLGDIVPKVQLGWTRGDFSHTAYIQTVTSTGRYEPASIPSLRLHLPGIDTGWAFYVDRQDYKLQFNGAVGVMFNFENTDTDYKTGNEFHFEWAVGGELLPGLVFGLVGYDYRQLTGDFGSGAHLGPFKGSVEPSAWASAAPPWFTKRPSFSTSGTYREFNADNHLEGNSTVGSVTVRF